MPVTKISITRISRVPPPGFPCPRIPMRQPSVMSCRAAVAPRYLHRLHFSNYVPKICLLWHSVSQNGGRKTP